MTYGSLAGVMIALIFFFVIGLGEDLDDSAGNGRRKLGVNLVGGDLDQPLITLDHVADLHEPIQHGSFGDGLAHLRNSNIDDRRLGLLLPVDPRLLTTAKTIASAKPNVPESRRACPSNEIEAGACTLHRGSC